MLLTTFSRSPAQWEHVLCAAEESKAVYKPAACSDGRHILKETRTGSEKTTILHRREVDGTPTVFISVRGSRSITDWMVNSNFELAPAEELGNGMTCHTGFLSVARTMESRVFDAVNDIHSPTEAPINIVFTGHSAGAAVAQILFGFVHGRNTRLSALKGDRTVSCITFGGPPITSSPIVAPASSLFLSFANEGDPVILAQPSYIQTLWKVYAIAPASLELPVSQYIWSGRCIILRDVAPDESDKIDIKPFEVQLEILRNILFGNPIMHSMTLYLERILLQRELNY
ncbi:uncharacterized protein K452DRAFT_223300 [Aplosporella prunicola CBS 121167]|uniref:Fungal lipase-type domain-containing protein n=1 Tax=Aplosporella prunicola CBS 121167 TaxID=1176127 RepID=A0A6A6BLR8_9PEZI|nr:uncharacterized protein K452DRAFT_223300 [Aplosporella prunicola CBS 121167]KAF2144353.1 hypothetical protein K452DRAFT_223300 [Aplosporella prunicola CBS 121167]